MRSVLRQHGWWAAALVAAGCGGSTGTGAGSTRDGETAAPANSAEITANSIPAYNPRDYPIRYRLQLRGEAAEHAPGTRSLSDGTGGQDDADNSQGLGQVVMTLSLPALGGGTVFDLPAVPGREARRQQVVEIHCEHTGRPVGAANQPVPRSGAATVEHARGDAQDVSGQAAESDAAMAVRSHPGGGWLLPEGCARVRYAIQAVPMGAAEPRAQLVSHRATSRQWLIPGAAVLLTPARLRSRPLLDLAVPDLTDVYHTLAGQGRVGLRLPAKTAFGRTLIAVGNFTLVHSLSTGSDVLHVLDKPDGVAFDGLEQGLAALEEMAGIVPPHRFHVFWVGHDRTSGQRLAGTDYLDAVLVNYWRDLPQDAPSTTRRAPLAVFYHQYFAALAGPRLPKWLTDSLGQYTALLAWRASGAINDRDLAALVRRGAPERARMSVPSAYQAWEASGSENDYQQFYRHGLGYWATLDEQLQRDTQGRAGLEAVIKPLLGLTYQQDGTPPQRFLEVLAEAGLQHPTPLTQTWLAWP